MRKFDIVLETIKEAWEKLDPHLLKSVLAENIIYHEDPNEPPLTSIEAVIKRWESDLETHSNITLNYKITDVKGDTCIAEWTAEWDDEKRGPRALRGVYYLRLSASGKLCEFRQWWL